MASANRIRICRRAQQVAEMYHETVRVGDGLLLAVIYGYETGGMADGRICRPVFVLRQAQNGAWIRMISESVDVIQWGE